MSSTSSSIVAPSKDSIDKALDVTNSRAPLPSTTTSSTSSVTPVATPGALVDPDGFAVLLRHLAALLPGLRAALLLVDRGALLLIPG